jgi:prepilin-type N-terminal cleavage/methylation domain-containing protein
MQPRGEQGLTLIELLVAMALSLVLMGAVVGILTVFLNDSNYDANRDAAQSDASTLVDRISRDLRSAAAQNTGSYGLLERAAPSDIEFETVNPGTTPVAPNNYNQYRVRYCLDGNDTVWRQTETWTTATPPAPPTATTRPDPSNVWTTTSRELSDVTNDSTTPTLFTYGPTGYTSIQQIQEVDIDVVTNRNPGHLPGPAPQLQSGVFLRNENSPPTASLSATPTSNGTNTWDVTLNGSASSDPNGQTLTYQWYANSGSTGCTNNTTGPSTGLLSNATTQIADGGTYASNATETFALVVTDTEGLTNCQSLPVTMP